MIWWGIALIIGSILNLVGTYYEWRILYANALDRFLDRQFGRRTTNIWHVITSVLAMIFGILIVLISAVA